MEQQPVGSHIVLVSNSEIRYEGLLHNIDPTSNTISLINVRIFGTEGRNNGINEVPPSNQLYEYIVFSGKDIKDITLYENQAPSADPAIVSATPARGRPGVPLPTPETSGGKTLTAVPRPGNAVSAPISGAAQPAATAAAAAAQPPARREQPASQPNPSAGAPGRRWGGNGGGYAREGGNNPRDRDNHGRYHHGGAVGGGGRGGASYYRGGYGGSSGRGGGHYRRRAEIHTGQDFQPATGAQKEELKEFDFGKSQEELAKQRQEFEKAKEDAKVYAKAYNKASFFDTISCDQKDRSHGPRMDREEMKRADAETFGSEMVGSMRGFRHSRGRGGRGRYGRY